MRSLTRLVSALCVVGWAATGLAQDIDPSQARPPSAEPAPEAQAPAPEAAPTAVPVEVNQERWKPTTHPRLYMHTDDANFLPTGWMEFEGALRVDFGTIGGQVLTTMAKVAPQQGFELRLGWDTVGVLETGGGDPITGVGDLFVESKFALDLGPNVDASMHRLAALVEARPGIGQDPVTVGGLRVGGYAVYTTYPGYVQVNAQAGLSTVMLNDTDLVLDMPLSGSVGYQALSWLRVHAELLESLNLRDLNNSGTRVLGNARWVASPYFAVDLGVAIGLTEAYPDASVYGAVTWRAIPLD